MPRTKTFDQEKVLESAMQLFWKKGFHATSMQDLVSHLGINRASLYGTYGDKGQLFSKAFINYKEQSRAGIGCYFENQPSIKVGFKRLFTDAVLDSVRDKDRKGCFVVNTTTELIPGDENIQKLLEENKKDVEDMFYSILKKGEHNGEISKDKDLRGLASYLFTFFAGLKIAGKVQPSRVNLSKTVEVALSVLD